MIAPACSAAFPTIGSRIRLMKLTDKPQESDAACQQFKYPDIVVLLISNQLNYRDSFVYSLRLWPRRTRTEALQGQSSQLTKQMHSRIQLLVFRPIQHHRRPHPLRAENSIS